jgi:hypothetical protein
VEETETVEPQDDVARFPRFIRDDQSKRSGHQSQQSHARQGRRLQKADKDHGTLDQKEAKAMPGVAKNFDAIDADKDGTVSLEGGRHLHESPARTDQVLGPTTLAAGGRPRVSNVQRVLTQGTLCAHHYSRRPSSHSSYPRQERQQFDLQSLPVIQLSGFVSSQAAIDKAVEVARGVKGVRVKGQQ